MSENRYYSKPIECNSEESILDSNGHVKEVTQEKTGQEKVIPQDKYSHRQFNIVKNNIYSGIEGEGNNWMALACDVAYRSVQTGGGPFGAIIVQIDDESKEVIRYWEARNQVTKQNDPTAHAEVLAIRSACFSLGVYNLNSIEKSDSKLPQKGGTSHCEIYSSCEPCPMCYSAIYWARIQRLSFAATRFDAEEPGVDFSDSAIYSDLNKPYKDRDLKVCRCITSNSLDAFNLWKNIDKKAY